MEFSFKQIASVLLALCVFTLALQGLHAYIQQQGVHIQKHTQVSTRNHEQQLCASGNVVDDRTKPIITQSIMHMRKGNYTNFSYETLIQANDYLNETITPNAKNSIHGVIDGSVEGVQILRCTLFDTYGNYVHYKIAVIIEGNANVNTMIHSYQEGVLL